MLGASLAEHRVVWKLHHGVDPKMDVHHLDGDKSNNRIANLRLATTQQRSFARKVGVTSTSGVKGVAWHCRMRKWQAYIYIDGRRFHLGTFDHFDHAVKARTQAEIEYHGEFRRESPWAA